MLRYEPTISLNLCFVCSSVRTLSQVHWKRCYNHKRDDCKPIRSLSLLNILFETELRLGTRFPPALTRGSSSNYPYLSISKLSYIISAVPAMGESTLAITVVFVAVIVVSAILYIVNAYFFPDEDVEEPQQEDIEMGRVGEGRSGGSGNEVA